MEPTPRRRSLRLRSLQVLRRPGGETATWPHGRDQETGKESRGTGTGRQSRAPRVNQTATGLGAVVAAGQVGSSWCPAHHHWGSAHAPTHPRSRPGSRTARGRCGQPCLRLLQCATRPHRHRPGRGLCTDPPPSRSSHHPRAAPTAARPRPAGRTLTWPDRTEPRGTTREATNRRAPKSRYHALIVAWAPPTEPTANQKLLCRERQLGTAPWVPPQPISAPCPAETTIILVPPLDSHGTSPAPPWGCPMGAALCAPPWPRPLRRSRGARSGSARCSLRPTGSGARSAPLSIHGSAAGPVGLDSRELVRRAPCSSRRA